MNGTHIKLKNVYIHLLVIENTIPPPKMFSLFQLFSIFFFERIFFHTIYSEYGFYSSTSFKTLPTFPLIQIQALPLLRKQIAIYVIAIK